MGGAHAYLALYPGPKRAWYTLSAHVQKEQWPFPKIWGICILTPYNFPFTWRSAGRKALSGLCYSKKRQ